MPSRDVGERFVDFADDVEDHADVHGFVELGEDDFVDADSSEALDGRFDAFLAGGSREYEVNFIRRGEGEEIFQLLELESIGR